MACRPRVRRRFSRSDAENEHAAEYDAGIGCGVARGCGIGIGGDVGVTRMVLAIR